MDAPRWRVVAALLGVGALLEGVAQWLYWRPCEGSVPQGTVFGASLVTDDIPPACMVALDRHPGFLLVEPGAGLTPAGMLSVVATALLALAWLLAVLHLPLSLWAKRCAALPGLLCLGLAVLGIAVDLRGEDWTEWLLGVTPVLIDISAVVVVTLLFATVRMEYKDAVPYALALLAATAPSFLHQVLDYGVAITLSEVNWDAPPGTGYVGVALILLTAGVIALVWGHGRGTKPSGGRPAVRSSRDRASVHD